MSEWMSMVANTGGRGERASGSPGVARRRPGPSPCGSALVVARACAPARGAFALVAPDPREGVGDAADREARRGAAAAHADSPREAPVGRGGAAQAHPRDLAG